jgi:hypothetical protein
MHLLHMHTQPAYTLCATAAVVAATASASTATGAGAAAAMHSRVWLVCACYSMILTNTILTNIVLMAAGGGKGTQQLLKM